MQCNSTTLAPFASAFYPYDYVSETYTPAGFDPYTLMALPGAVFYQEGARNVAAWTNWPKRAGSNHFSCPQTIASSETVGFLLAASTGSISQFLGWALEIDAQFYERVPFQAVSLVSPPLKGDDVIRHDQDSDLSDLTDMDRLTQAIREIALRTVEKNPGPQLDLFLSFPHDEVRIKH